MIIMNTNNPFQNRPAIFLDRDGTIVEDVGYISTIEQIVWFPDTITALKRLSDRFPLFVVSNQSGIAIGELTTEAVAAVNSHIDATLARHGIRIQKWYVCPHSRKDECRCMKPSPFFLYEAVREYGVSLTGSYAIGDHPHDLSFIENQGGTGLYLLTGHGARHRGELSDRRPVYPTLTHAVDSILRITDK